MGYTNPYADLDGNPHWFALHTFKWLNQPLRMDTPEPELAARYSANLVQRKEMSKFDRALLNLNAAAHQLRQGQTSEADFLDVAQALADAIRPPMFQTIIPANEMWIDGKEPEDIDEETHDYLMAHEMLNDPTGSDAIRAMEERFYEPCDNSDSDEIDVWLGDFDDTHFMIGDDE